MGETEDLEVQLNATCLLTEIVKSTLYANELLSQRSFEVFKQLLATENDYRKQGVY